MKNQPVDQITNNMPLGYALHEFVKDENGQPCDYIFIEANSAFGKYTGLNPDEIIGKKVTEVHPDIGNDPFNWIKAYSKVAYNGESLQFEQYFQPSKKWYKIYAYQPKYGYFITLFEDITETKEIESQNIILETELKRQKILIDVYMNEYTNEQEFLDNVLHRALEMSKSEYGYIYLYDEEASEFKLNSWTDGVMPDCSIMDKQTVYQLEKTGIWGEVVRQRKPIVVNDFDAPNELKKGYPKGHVEIQNYMSIPVFEEGNIAAVVGVANNNAGYSEFDINQLILLMQSAWSIKKQKELEEELQRFKIISDNALYGKVIANLNGHIIYVNKFFANIHGYKSEELLGKPISIFHSQSQLDLVERINEKMLRTGYFDMQEVWHKHRNGTEFPMLMSGVLLKDDKGKPEYMAVTAVDITDQKQIEERLKEAYHIAKLGRWDYYHVENKLQWTDTIFDIFEIDAKEFEATYEAFLEVVHPDDRIAVDEAWSNSLVDKKPYNIDHRLLMDDGRVKWIHEQCRTEFNKEGQPIHSIGVVQDVTERKNLERQLFREKEQFKTTLLSVGDGVISTDSQGNIVILNPIAEQLTGWTQEEAAGQPVEKVFNIINEFTREKCENPVQQVLEAGKIIELANHTLLISKDGIERPIEDSAAPIKDEQGNITGVVLVFRDFTEKKRIQDRIEYLSFHDSLTRLYNRRFFEEEMKRLDIPQSYPLTVMMGDLNGLKLTNDAFGHHEGDKLLKQTADLFKTHLRDEDIVARWGGDEFAVLLPQKTSEEAEEIVQSIIQDIKRLNAEKNKGILSIAFGWDTKIDSEVDLDHVFKNAEEYMYRKKISESQSVRGLTIKTIINTLFEKSPREEKHSQRVRKLAIKIAKELNLSQHEVEDISTLGLLHDIGKIIISGEVLEKPGRLTESEYDEVKKHSSIGFRILSAINEFSSITDGVLSHHERWDGKGYPKGIKGDQIPLKARIIAVADSYDAMTEERPYKEKMNKEEAIKELKKCSGTQFDPDITKVFIDKVLLKEE